MAAGRRGGRVKAADEPEPEPEPAPSGLPDEDAEGIPLGIPPDDEEADRELPGFPREDIDTAG